MGKSTTQKTEQTNKPPEWAEPLLRKGAGEAMNLYDSGAGYNVYNGPTQAGFSAPTLGGMNAALAATGYSGAPVSNATWQNSPELAQVQKLLTQQAAAKAQAAAAKPAAPAQTQPLWYQNADGMYVQAKAMSPEDVQKANKQTQYNNIRQNTQFRGGRGGYSGL